MEEAETAARWLIDQMSTAFDDALVTEWELLDGIYGLPDPDDEHVVAAAVVGRAEVMVTSNLRHFPAARLPAPVRAISPNEFVYDTVRQHLTQACRAVIEITERSGRRGPKLTATSLLHTLRDRYEMSETVEILFAAPVLRDVLRT